MCHVCLRPRFLAKCIKWDYSSAGEHFVDIEGVTGSIPVSPTISTKIKYFINNIQLAVDL